MTEKTWLEATRASKLVQYVDGKVSARKMALFTAAFQRRVLDGLPVTARAQVRELCERAEQMGPDDAHPWGEAPLGCEAVVVAAARLHLDADVLEAMRPLGSANRVTSRRWQNAWDEAMEAERLLQCAFARDIFGNPFRPVTLDLDWLHANAARALAIARTLYDDRSFDDLPILADMLEDAGLDNRDLLDHLRGGGVHTRGCWALDLLLELR